MTFFGSKGTAHIGSEDFAAFVNSLHGGDAIFSIEDNMACTMTDANTASVALGACVLQGYFYHHEEVDDLEVANGSIGYNRHDLVVATYTLGTDSGNNAVQDVYLRVIQGTATVGEASDPEYADGSIAGGDTLVDFPLYRLTIEGVSTPAVERVMALEAPIQSQVDANASAITALGESVSQTSDDLASFKSHFNIANAEIGMVETYNNYEYRLHLWAEGNVAVWRRQVGTVNWTKVRDL